KLAALRVNQDHTDPRELGPVSRSSGGRHYLAIDRGAKAAIRFQTKQSQPIVLSLVPLGQLLEPQRRRDVRLQEQTNFNLHLFNEGPVQLPSPRGDLPGPRKIQPSL